MNFKIIVMFIGLIFSIKSLADFSADIKKTEYLVYAVNVMSTNQAPLKKLIKVTSTKDQQKVDEKFNEFTKSGIKLKGFYNQLYVYNKKNELMYTIEKDYSSKNTILINGFARFSYDPKNIWGSLFEGENVNKNNETSIFNFLIQPAYAIEIDNSRRVLGKDYSIHKNADNVVSSIERTTIYLASKIYSDEDNHIYNLAYDGRSPWTDLKNDVVKDSIFQVGKNNLKKMLGMDIDLSESKTQCIDDKNAKADISVHQKYDRKESLDKVFTVTQSGSTFKISEPDGDKSVYYKLNVTSEIVQSPEIKDCLKLKSKESELKDFLINKAFNSRISDQERYEFSGSYTKNFDYKEVGGRFSQIIEKSKSDVKELMKQNQKDLCTSSEYLDLISSYKFDKYQDNGENRHSRHFTLMNKLNPEKCVNNSCTKIDDTTLLRGLVNDNKINLFGDKKIGWKETEALLQLVDGLKIVQHLGFCCSDKKCKAELKKDFDIELKGPAPSKKLKSNQ